MPYRRSNQALAFAEPANLSGPTTAGAPSTEGGRARKKVGSALATDQDLQTLVLDGLHRELGGKMVPFAGYSMPVQYKDGVKTEHLHTRSAAGLFDVSHMGQAYLTLKEGTGGPEAHKKIADAIERLVPGEIRKLPKGRIRYSVLLSDEGGILDDLMITRLPNEEDAGKLFLVVNAAVKDQDFAYLSEKLGDVAELTVLDDRCLLALQGPKTAEVLARLLPGIDTLPFMGISHETMDGTDILVSRCGYTGEDGYELSVLSSAADAIARKLLSFEEVAPIGLGARDSLRLEVGLCLYGHDMTAAESPVEASLDFTIGKRRREEGGFAGATRVLSDLHGAAGKRRVGIKPEGRAPAREGVAIHLRGSDTALGHITSGTFGPTADGPIAMGYVDATHADDGTQLDLILRGKPVPATIVPLPFVPQRYYRAPSNP